MPGKARSRPRRGPRFLLNPYADQAFTRYPRCDRAPTRVRKVCLVVLVEPGLNLVLNKVYRLCERCDLLIVKQAELEGLMAYVAEQRDPSVIGNDYHVIGTLDRADWRLASKDALPPAEIAARVKPFREVLHFEGVRGGWMPPGDQPAR